MANKLVLTIDGRRDGYALDQIKNTMTVGELMNLLSDYDEDTPVMINNDNGYTYGAVRWDSFREEYNEGEEEQ